MKALNKKLSKILVIFLLIVMSFMLCLVPGFFVPIDWLEVDNWLYTIGWNKKRIYISVFYYGFLTLNHPQPGDFYFDGEVNVTDFSEFCDHWLESAGISLQFDGLYDLNHNGKTDFLDFCIFAEGWK
jgi:hypothetical protein